MTEIGKVRIECRFDLFGDLLNKLSEEGLSDLEAAIIGERYRRKEIKTKFPELED